jgi:phosphohistidine swiveling domain-containing protein
MANMAKVDAKKKEITGKKESENGKENQNIADIVKDLMSKEDRKDAEFRFVLLTTEVGDVGKYITHDPKLNPGARPHGSREDEKLAYGQVIVMLRALTYLRGIDYDEAQSLGLRNWQDADWRKREAQSKNEVKGRVACLGFSSGQAYVVDKENTLNNLVKLAEPRIIVMKTASPDFAIAMQYATGLVTDHGGYTSHAASIARERNIPCIVGTGNATELIKHNQIIHVEAGLEKGKEDVGRVYLE